MYCQKESQKLLEKKALSLSLPQKMTVDLLRTPDSGREKSVVNWIGYLTSTIGQK
jgi:hypothetical protein